MPWQDDEGKWHANHGYRVQYNSTLGPYKGGIRFHPSVNESIMKFLAFEQIFKNALTSLPIGGGKGGSDFDPKGKSDAEIMRFCQSFMTELQKYIGPDTDVPLWRYRSRTSRDWLFIWTVQTSKFVSSGRFNRKTCRFLGSLARKEATGYGLVYFVKHLLADQEEVLENKRVVVSGSGNVAIYAIEKAQSLGALVLTCSDSSGYIYDEKGIDLETVKKIKEEQRGRISAYLEVHPEATYVANESVWSLSAPYEIALPCATQNEITQHLAQDMIKAGVKLWQKAQTCHQI